MQSKNEYQIDTLELKKCLFEVSIGNQIEFNKLIQLYWNKVYTQAITYLKNHNEAQEITQDVFLKIWNTRSYLTEMDNFSNYLFIISRNLTISSLRKKRLDVNSITEDLVFANERPDEQLQYKEFYNLVMQAIDLLPSTRKKVFKMSRFEGYSYEEIGEKLSISKNAVKDHIVKALNFLRTQAHFKEKGYYSFLLAILIPELF